VAGLGSSPFARRYLGNHCCFLFLQVLRWFSSLGFPFTPYGFRCEWPVVQPAGLPHSAIRGSRDVCSSPRLFAAYHGLLRTVAPRHPPWTLSRLTIFSFVLYFRGLSPRPLCGRKSITASGAFGPCRDLKLARFQRSGPTGNPPLAPSPLPRLSGQRFHGVLHPSLINVKEHVFWRYGGMGT
jgi:hypothetical protein